MQESYVKKELREYYEARCVGYVPADGGTPPEECGMGFPSEDGDVIQMNLLGHAENGETLVAKIDSF